MDHNSEPDWIKRFRAPHVDWADLADANSARGLVINNSSGVLQLYAWDVPTSSLRPLTNEPEGVRSGLISPDGRYVCYMLDHAGDEIGHFARVAFEGGAPEDLTPGLPPYSSFSISFSRDARLAAFGAAGEWGFRFYALPFDEAGCPGEPQLFYTSTRMVAGPLLSPGGELAILASTERTGMQHYALLAVDPRTGQVQAELWDGPGASLQPLGFSPLPGDLRLLAATTRTGATRPLVWNPHTGERADLPFESLPGDVEPVNWSPDAGRLLLCHSHQAVQRLFLYDLRSGEQTWLDHPSGTYSFFNGGGTFFAPSGEIYTLWEDAVHPMRLVALDARTGRVLRTVLTAGEVPPGRPWRSVAFPSSDGQLVQAWLATPPGDGPFPAILDTHGGPEGVMPEAFMPSCQAWLDHGFAFLTVNYRGSTNFGREFQEKIWGDLGNWEVEDMVAARRFLVEQGIAHPGQVFLTGWSYGGYLTLLAAGKRPELWAGGMAGIAIADWTIQYEESAGTLRGYQAAMFGGAPDEKPEQYRKSSPITYVENVQAPLLVIQGRNDTRCPARPMQLYEQRLKEMGKPIEVHWFDAGHGSLRVDESIHHQQLMLDFALRLLGRE